MATKSKNNISTDENVSNKSLIIAMIQFSISISIFIVTIFFLLAYMKHMRDNINYYPMDKHSVKHKFYWSRHAVFISTILMFG